MIGCHCLFQSYVMYVDLGSDQSFEGVINLLGAAPGSPKIQPRKKGVYCEIMKMTPKVIGNDP